MRKSGVPESVIMKIMGHSTREMFLRYDSVDERDAWNAVDRMIRLLECGNQKVDPAPQKQKEG
jgi:hypothetical protein